MTSRYKKVIVVWSILLQLGILILPGFGNSIFKHNTIIYFAFGDSIAVYNLPDNTLEPINYVSWRDSLESNNFYVVYYTDALTRIEKLDPSDYRVESGWWEWANVKIEGYDSVWVKNSGGNISLKDSINYSPTGTVHSFHRISVGDGFWMANTTVILDSNETRISPILYHKDWYSDWISRTDIMLFSENNFNRKKFGDSDYYLPNDGIFIYDASIHDTIFLSYGYGPVYSERSNLIIFLRENPINEIEKEIQLCSIGLDGNSFTIIKSLNNSDFGLIQSNCLGYDYIESSEIQIENTGTSDLYEFRLFYIYDCNKYTEKEDSKSKVIAIDSNGKLIE